MALNIRFFKGGATVSAGIFSLLFTGSPTQAVTINFAAVIASATCQISLNKSSLYLGSVPLKALSTGNVLALSQPVSLQIRRCEGVAGGGLKPRVKVSGEGFSAAGDNKWLFRSADSQAKGIGILLMQGEKPPGYEQAEVKHGDYLTVGSANVVPIDTDIPLYVGVSCGANAACRANTIKPGRLTARIIFDFTYL